MYTVEKQQDVLERFIKEVRRCELTLEPVTLNHEDARVLSVMANAWQIAQVGGFEDNGMFRPFNELGVVLSKTVIFHALDHGLRNVWRRAASIRRD